MRTKTRNFAYLLSLTPGLAVILGNLQGGWYSILNFIYSLVVLGAAEWLLRPNKQNNHSEKDDALPAFILYLHLPLQALCLASYFYGIYSNILQGYWIWAAAISMGVNTGSAAIVVAHELIHRKERHLQFFGRWLLFTAGNFYFFIEHLRVHHKWVGTSKDSATARKGQNLYSFFLSSGMGQIKGAWQLESERLRKAGKSIWSLNHYVVRQVVLHLLLDVLIWYLLGYIALLGFVLHCVVANFLLEYVNYIEHYGLSRDEKERVTELHSWQSDIPVSRFLLIDLSRHADHHYHASKPYHTLLSYEKSPELPSGYAGLFFVAAIPPLWFSLMDARIEGFKN
ncbi:MAG: alkane 1-monooxygenase [Bacteroidota bacterium]